MLNLFSTEVVEVFDIFDTMTITEVKSVPEYSISYPMSETPGIGVWYWYWYLVWSMDHIQHSALAILELTSYSYRKSGKILNLFQVQVYFVSHTLPGTMNMKETYY